MIADGRKDGGKGKTTAEEDEVERVLTVDRAKKNKSVNLHLKKRRRRSRFTTSTHWRRNLTGINTWQGTRVQRIKTKNLNTQKINKKRKVRKREGTKTRRPRKVTSCS